MCPPVDLVLLHLQHPRTRCVLGVADDRKTDSGTIHAMVFGAAPLYPVAADLCCISPLDALRLLVNPLQRRALALCCMCAAHAVHAAQS